MSPQCLAWFRRYCFLRMLQAQTGFKSMQIKRRKS